MAAPALPFLGLMLSECVLLTHARASLMLCSITFTIEGNPNLRPSPIDPDTKLINHDKYVKLSKIASDFQRFQVVSPATLLDLALKTCQPYNLGEIPEVQKFLKKVLNDKGSGSVDALYRKSCELAHSLPTR